MFRNLEAEFSRIGKNKKDISTETGIEYKTFLNKLNGKTLFNKKEMFLIKKKYFPNLTIDYLFEEDSDVNE